MRGNHAKFELDGAVQVTLAYRPDSVVREELQVCNTCGMFVSSITRNPCCKGGNCHTIISGSSLSKHGEDVTFRQLCEQVAKEVGPSAFIHVGFPWDPEAIAVFRKVRHNA